MDYGSVIGLVVCAVLVDRFAGRGKIASTVWTILSVVVSILAIKFIPWGVWGLVGCQVVLLVVIAVSHLWAKETVPLD